MAPKNKRKVTEDSSTDPKRARYAEEDTSSMPKAAGDSTFGGTSSALAASQPGPNLTGPTVGLQHLSTLQEDTDVYGSEQNSPETVHDSSAPAGTSSADEPRPQSGRGASEDSDEFGAALNAEFATGKYYESQVSRGATQESGDLEAGMMAEFDTGKYHETLRDDEEAAGDEDESTRVRKPDYSDEAMARWKKMAAKSKKGKAPMPRLADDGENSGAQDQSLPSNEITRQLLNTHSPLDNDPEGFVSRTEFESDDHPETIAEFGYRRVQEGETKLNAEGVPHKSNRARFKQKTTGEYILPSTITTRPSATEKYMSWQKSSHNTCTEQKTKREIILIEHEPDGQAREPDRWAAKLAPAQWNSIAGQLVRNGSRFTIHVDVTDIRLNALGLAKKWHEALLTLGRMKPQVTIVIDDDSILTANAASYYPADTIDAACSAMNHYNFNDRATIVTQTPDLDPDDPGDFQKGVERIRTTKRAYYARQCADIDENITSAQEFVHSMRRLRNYVTKSPSVEIISRPEVEEGQGDFSGGAAGIDATGTSDDPVQLD